MSVADRLGSGRDLGGQDERSHGSAARAAVTTVSAGSAAGASDSLVDVAGLRVGHATHARRRLADRGDRRADRGGRRGGRRRRPRRRAGHPGDGPAEPRARQRAGARAGADRGQRVRAERGGRRHVRAGGRGDRYPVGPPGSCRSSRPPSSSTSAAAGTSAPGPGPSPGGGACADAWSDAGGPRAARQRRRRHRRRRRWAEGRRRLGQPGAGRRDDGRRAGRGQRGRARCSTRGPASSGGPGTCWTTRRRPEPAALQRHRERVRGDAPRAMPPAAAGHHPGVVATDATLTKARCAKVAGIAHDGLARAISPVHTMFDGDTAFALSTARRPATRSAAARAADGGRGLHHAGRRARGAGRGDGRTAAGRWPSYREELLGG